MRGGAVGSSGEGYGDIERGIVVLQENDNAAGTWYEAFGRTGRSDMNIFGGNEGERIRMYHPRLGL